MAILYIPRTLRSVQRMYQIARVLTRHGFGDLVERLELKRYVPFGRRLGLYRPLPEPPVRGHELGRRLVAVAQDLGPTFVKLGQLLSTRPDLIPADIVQQLARLQDHVAPFPTSDARAIVADDLGGPVEQFFAQFPDQPLASGSIAQTYLARTVADDRVVVKVRRPGISSTITLDMHILEGLAQAAENLIPELQVYRPVQFVEELARTIQRELDFIHEASATTRFHEAFSASTNHHIVVPRVFWEFTGNQVLTIEYLQGQSLHAGLAQEGAITDRPRLARQLAEAFLDQYFELGMFHADPHPGNLLLMTDQRIGLLDFGMIGRLDDDLRTQLIVALIAAVRKDVDLVADVMGEIGSITEETDVPALKRDLLDLLEKYYGLPLRRIEMQTVFLELSSLVREHRVRLPRDFVLFGKSLVTVAGVALQLDPNLNLLELIRPRVRSMIAQQLSPDRWLRMGGISLWHGLHILRDAPRLMRDILRRAGRGQMSLQIRHQHFDNLISELDRSSNRIAFSVVVAAIIVGSSLILHAKLAPYIAGDISLLGLIGYVMAGLMGVLLIFAILRSGKLS